MVQIEMEAGWYYILFRLEELKLMCRVTLRFFVCFMPWHWNQWPILWVTREKDLHGHGTTGGMPIEKHIIPGQCSRHGKDEK